MDQMDQLKKRRGQTTVEYTLICAVILAALILAVGATGDNGKPTIGGAITRLFDGLKDLLKTSVERVPNTFTTPSP